MNAPGPRLPCPRPPAPAGGPSRRAFAWGGVALLAAACVALWFAPGAAPVAQPPGETCRARVLAVDDSTLQTLGFVPYGTQALEVELLSGPRRGERFQAANHLRAQLELDKRFAPGDVALVSLPADASAETVLTARDHWRLGWMAGAFLLFAALLLAFGGRTGAKALFSFLFCCLAVWKCVVPLTLAGWNASLVAFGATAAMTAAIMFLVGGATRKALAAFGGSMLGVAAGLALAHGFGRLMAVNGATLPFVQTLLFSGFAGLDLADVFIAATVLAGSGAMMDLAMDIAAGVREVAWHNPALGRRALLLSGLRIGRATVGTMTTTLLLAYSGGYLTLLMVFAAQGVPPADFLNSPIVAAETVKTLVGSFAIVLVAPFTALLAALLFAPRRGFL